MLPLNFFNGQSSHIYQPKNLRTKWKAAGSNLRATISPSDYVRSRIFLETTEPALLYSREIQDEWRTFYQACFDSHCERGHLKTLWKRSTRGCDPYGLSVQSRHRPSWFLTTPVLAVPSSTSPVPSFNIMPSFTSLPSFLL